MTYVLKFKLENTETNEANTAVLQRFKKDFDSFGDWFFKLHIALYETELKLEHLKLIVSVLEYTKAIQIEHGAFDFELKETYEKIRNFKICIESLEKPVPGYKSTFFMIWED